MTGTEKHDASPVKEEVVTLGHLSRLRLILMAIETI